jgi:hypothetical protein
MTEGEIKKLVIDGQVCAVFNHRWTFVSDIDDVIHITKNYLGEAIVVKPSMVRRCELCGEVEIMPPTTWEPYKEKI